MFNWLRRWKLWRQSRTRAIFPYWDGQKWRTADPITIYRAIKSHPDFNLERHPEMHDAGDDEATLICLKAARDIFGVKSLQEGGLTETETIDLLGAYFEWISDVKKNISTSLTSPELMVSPPYCGMEPGNRSADSISTSAVPSCAAPTP